MNVILNYYINKIYKYQFIYYIKYINILINKTECKTLFLTNSLNLNNEIMIHFIFCIIFNISEFFLNKIL